MSDQNIFIGGAQYNWKSCAVVHFGSITNVLSDLYLKFLRIPFFTENGKIKVENPYHFFVALRDNQKIHKIGEKLWQIFILDVSRKLTRKFYEFLPFSIKKVLVKFFSTGPSLKRALPCSKAFMTQPLSDSGSFFR